MTACLARRTVGRASALLAGLVTMAVPAPAPAQVPASGGAGGAGLTWVVSHHPQAPLVATALRLGSGSRADPAGRGGTAWITGHAVLAGMTRALQGSSASVSIEVGRGWTLFTLLAPADEWRSAVAILIDGVFRAEPDSGDVEAARTELLEHLRFEEGSPVRAFRREAIRLLAGPDDPWTRPVDGSTASAAAVTPAAVLAYRGREYFPGNAMAAVIGPLTEPTVSEALGPSAPHATPRAGHGPDLPAWLTGDRFSLTREVTNAWIAVDYPARPSTARTTLEFLAHLIQEDLDPYPPPEDVYNVSVRVEDAPGGPVIRVEASVFPESASRWESRILAAVEAVGKDTMAADFFRWKRRRFRTARLLADVAPEREAARITQDLLRTGRVRILNEEIRGLSPGVVAAAVRAMGEPRILVMGPDLGQGRGAGSGGKSDGRLVSPAGAPESP